MKDKAGKTLLCYAHQKGRSSSTLSLLLNQKLTVAEKKLET